MLFDIIIILIGGYFFGIFNAGYALGKLIKKIDIRDAGSHNAGASNATIVLGWKFGILTAVIDILKSTLAVYLVRLLFAGPDYYMFIAGLAVVLGHNYPFYMKFKGGKGTASVIGMFLAIDIKIALIMSAAIILITVLTDYIVIGTAVMYFLSLILVYKYFSINCLIITLFLTVLSMYKHRMNFVKIARKEEIALSSLWKKKQ